MSMKGIYSHQWLQTFFKEPLPAPETVREGLLKHSFEVEGTQKTENGDTVYELDILPNRSSDCLAHYGIAKEIAAIFSLPLQRQYFQKKFAFADAAKYIQTDRCDRYAILKIEAITLAETPPEIRQQLEAVGQRCIHPIVDLSNYILLDIGQPIHAFDAKKVSGQFGVRQARADERLVLLGGEEVALREDDVVITDTAADRAIALAGVKGGEETKVDESTSDIYVEIASFNSVSVRHTMRRTGQVSDAALRFSQGFPPELIDYTAHRVAEVFGVYGSVTNSYDHQRTALRRQLHTGVSVSEVNNLLGTAYTQKEIAAVLDRLGLSYEYLDPRERFLAAAKEQLGKPYKWGASVSRDAPDAFDCSSFMCWCAAQAGKSIPRMSINQYLFATPSANPQPGDIVFSVSSDPKAVVRYESVFEEGCPVVSGTVKKGISHVGSMVTGDTFINARGSDGKVVISAIADEDIVGFGRIWDGEKRFAVAIPVERPDIRDENDLIEEVGRLLGYDTVPSGMSATGRLHSLWVQVKDRLLEVNDEMFMKRLAVLQALQSVGFSEVMTSSFTANDEVCVARPVAKDKGCLRSSLRQGIAHTLKKNAYNGELLGLDAVRIAEIGSVFTKDGERVHLALGVQETLGRKRVAVETVEKAVRKVLRLPGSFENGVWEVPLEKVQVRAVRGSAPSGSTTHYLPPSKYPFVLRDVAVFVPEGATSAKTETLLRNNGGNHLRQINLFDAFEKDGRQSYAFRLVFQSDTETLDDETVNRQMDTLYEILKQNNYEVR